MKLRDRIGIDISRRLKLEDALEWAARNGLKHIDIQLDTGENALPKFDAKRCAGVRKLLDRHGIALGLHTNSAVNVAEYSPVVADAVTEYLETYVNLVPKLGASWTEMHAGYHFTKDKEARMAAGRERLKRIVGHAEKKKVLVLLENLNKEPENAEVTTSRIPSRNGSTTGTSSRPRSSSASPPTTRTWSPRASRVSSGRSNSSASARCG